MTTTPPPDRGRKPRRRGLIVAAIAVAVVVLVIGADAVFGAVAQQRASCRVVDGVTVKADLKAIPVTLGLISGSVGTATAHVPWDVVAERAAAQVPQDAPLSFKAEDGRVIAETTVQGLAVSLTLQAEVTPAGELSLSPTGLTAAGRQVPLALAQAFGGADGLLQPRVLSSEEEFGLAAEVTSVAIVEDGLDLSLRLPMDTLTSSNRGQECPTESP